MPKKKTLKVKMKSKALSPQQVPGIGEIKPGEVFPVDEETAQYLEKGLFERVKGGDK